MNNYLFIISACLFDNEKKQTNNSAKLGRKNKNRSKK